MISSQFESRKLDDGTTDSARENLKQDMDNLLLELITISELYNDNLKLYSDTLKGTIDSADPYLSQSELVKLHRTTKKEAHSQVWFMFIVKLCESSLLLLFIDSQYQIKIKKHLSKYTIFYFTSTNSFQRVQTQQTIDWRPFFRTNSTTKSKRCSPFLSNSMKPNWMNLSWVFELFIQLTYILFIHTSKV